MLSMSLKRPLSAPFNSPSPTSQDGTKARLNYDTDEGSAGVLSASLSVWGPLQLRRSEDGLEGKSLKIPYPPPLVRRKEARRRGHRDADRGIRLRRM
jgi:hypothetical protein